MAYDQLKKNLPTYFNNFLQILGDNHEHFTRRQKLDFSISNTVTYGTNNIKNNITRHWNETVNELVIDPLQVSKSSYKSHLKAYFLDSLI